MFRDFQQKEGLEVLHFVLLWSKDRPLGCLLLGSRKGRDFSSVEMNLLISVSNQIAASIEKILLLDETRQAYDNLRHTQEQLLQSEKMAAVGQLISGVAHELNNPLTAILGYSQLLSSNKYVNEQGADYVDKLYKQARRTHRIVNNLLSFARQQKPERLPVRINQVIEDTLALREYDLRINNIHIHRDLERNLPLTGADAQSTAASVPEYSEQRSRRDTRTIRPRRHLGAYFAGRPVHRGGICGQRPRDAGHAPGIRSILYDEARWKGNGSGAKHLLRNYFGTRRRDFREERYRARRVCSRFTSGFAGRKLKRHNRFGSRR